MLKSFVNSLCHAQNGRILVVGDVMLDRFVEGEVKRISPEAPVPVLSKTHITTSPGGAGNVAANIAHLGCNVDLVGLIGDDDTGQELREILSEHPGISFHPFQIAGGQTTLKTRYSCKGQQLLRVDQEIVSTLNKSELEKFTFLIIDNLKCNDLVIISDYAKGCLPEVVLRQLITAAKDLHKIVIVDPKLPDFSSYAGVDLITPNLSELKIASYFRTDDMVEACSEIMKSHDINSILVTLSEKGLIFADKHGFFHEEPSVAREVFDVSGAGDTVVAAMAVALLGQMETKHAVKVANFAAGIVVGKSGTSAISIGEIIHALGANYASKDLSFWINRCRTWRSKGEVIGFVNGCFDLLHPGHLSLIAEAAKHCDKLIIGLNSDESVRTIKEPTRPIQTQSARASILASLPYVDGVVIFEESTPMSLIENLEPDVMFKGDEYRGLQIVGKEFIEKAGGSVILVPTLPGYSTTKFLAK